MRLVLRDKSHTAYTSATCRDEGPAGQRWWSWSGSLARGHGRSRWGRGRGEGNCANEGVDGRVVGAGAHARGVANPSR